MRARSVAGLLLFFACGEAEPTTEERLQGVWFVETADQFDCLLGIVLSADGTYERDFVCPLESGGFGIEATLGTWFASGEELRLFPRSSSCPDAPIEGQFYRYIFAGEQLRLVSPDGFVAFERTDDGTKGSLVARFGCYGEARIFTPNPVESLL